MPAIRTNTVALRLDLGTACSRGSSFHNEIIRDEFSLRERTDARHTQPSPPTSLPVKPTKKKKSPNAFILFRSHAIAKNMLPKGVTHQNDVSRMVADLWRVQDRETRDHFFERAKEEKIRFQLGEYVHVDKNKRKKKPKVRTNACTHGTTRLDDAKKSSVLSYPDICPGTPALSVGSSVSDQTGASSQYSEPDIEEVCSPSSPDELPPLELSYRDSALNIEHPKCVEPDYPFTPEQSTWDFEWYAASPASSLFFTSSRTPENSFHLDLDTAIFDMFEYF